MKVNSYMFAPERERTCIDCWLLGLDGAISWDPYTEDDGIEYGIFSPNVPQ